jgi:hypothetical protein
LENNGFDNIDTEAVLVMDNSKKELGNFIRRFLSKDEVLLYQKKVVSGEVTPNY